MAMLPKAACLPMLRAMKLATRPLADAWARAGCWWPPRPTQSDPAVQALCGFSGRAFAKDKASIPQAVMDAPGWARCTLPPMDTPTPVTGPLAGLKVLELGQLIAGPFAAKTLADFGADVVKIEPPESGDPLRKWRLLKDGTSVWWQVQSRNKRSVALDLRDPEAQDIVRKLAAEADVLIENFRPGAMEGWGLGPDALQALNPRLIMLRISGYGQTGPYRDRPGFGVVAEAMGGLRHLTAEPGPRAGARGREHWRHAGVVAWRDRHFDGAAPPPPRGGVGQVIDVALYEAVFNCMESLLPEYSAFGAVRGPAGSALPGIAPSNAYRCRDGGYALIAGNGDSIFKRLMATIGRNDLGKTRHWPTTPAAWPGWKRSTPPLAPGRPPARWTRCWRRWTGGGTGRAHLHRGRHCGRPALPGARHDRAGADGRRHQLAVPGIVPKLSLTPGATGATHPRWGRTPTRCCARWA
jgi:crotonobetainyl-CoA:carnitine CoA-transferase CaiB-like acyl-CoA transferase